LAGGGGSDPQKAGELVKASAFVGEILVDLLLISRLNNNKIRRIFSASLACFRLEGATKMSTDQPLPPDRDHAMESGSPAGEPRTLRSEDLLQGEKEIVIVHENQLYRLRRTRNGKLILQK
jgi:hemin uptake protein HemP